MNIDPANAPTSSPTVLPTVKYAIIHAAAYAKNATAHNYLGITAMQKGWAEAALG